VKLQIKLEQKKIIRIINQDMVTNELVKYILLHFNVKSYEKYLKKLLEMVKNYVELGMF
jgi:hypothetical protein